MDLRFLILDWGETGREKEILDCRIRVELSYLLWQDDHRLFEAILAEVGIKGESMIEFMMIDQGKAGTVNKAEIFVVVSYKDHLGRPFNGFTYTKDFDPGPVKTLHKLDSRPVTYSGTNERIGFREDKIGR